MKVLIPFTLLLFEFECSLGHTLPRKELLKNVDVYSIHENNHDAITIVNPKTKKPTVKEIIYYHLIERPYENSKVMVNHKEETVQGSVFDDTSRPFTNSHGLQFIDLDRDDEEDYVTSEETINLDEENAQSSVDDTHEELSSEVDDNIESADEDNDSNDNSRENESSEENSGDGESGDEEADDADDDADEDEEDLNNNVRIFKLPDDINSATDVVSSSSKEPVISECTETAEKSSTTEMLLFKEDQKTRETTTEAVTVTTETTTTTKVDAVAKEVVRKRAARNLLFNQLRDKYQKSVKPTDAVASRKKRDVESEDEQDADDSKELPEMPEAPILPKLNFDELPSYIRDMISTENPGTLELDKNNDNAEKEIDHLIEEMLNEVMKPYEEEDREESQEDKPKKPRTYGMKLTRGTGYVWNDLWSNPGMSFDVGDSPSHTTDEEQEETIDELQEHEIEPYEEDTSEEKLETVDSRRDLDEIFVNKENNENKPTDEMEEYLENGESDKTTVKSEPYIDKDVFEHMERQHDKQSNEKHKGNKKHKDTTDQSTFDITEAYDKDRETLENSKNITQKRKFIEDIAPHQPKRIKNIKEILNNHDKDFWTWLQEWTTTYMDLLMKHIKKIVQKEVKNQLQLNHLELENPPEDRDTLYEPNKDETRIEHKQAPSTDESITIDGVKIPLTHNTNYEFNHTANGDEKNEQSKSKLLKGRRHKNKNSTLEENNADSKISHRKTNSLNVTDEKSMKEGKIDANNIFGNSYNNDKVTNIYIFYPNSDSKKVIKDLNLDKGNYTDIIIGKPEATKFDEIKGITTEDSNEESKLIKEEIIPIIDNKVEITTPSEQKEILQATESSKRVDIESTKQPENSADEKKNDNTELSQASSTERAINQIDTEKDTDMKDTSENGKDTDMKDTSENGHNAVDSNVSAEKNDTSETSERQANNDDHPKEEIVTT